jgi:hypothetical protein
MKILPALLLVSLVGLATSCTNMDTGGGGGGTVEVNFQSPEQFTDMGRNYSTLRGADEGYLSEFREYIERRGAGRIPAGYTLSVTITDVDMAGQFEPERGAQFTDIRMIKTIYPPRINLNYRLTDQNGAVVSEGERQLRNQSFEWTVSPVDQQDPLRYEKELIDTFIRDVAGEVR